MLDCVIRGGTVVDGTGRPAVQTDVGIRHSRVVVIGPVHDRASHEIDATGLIVAPGFVDIHTHYDAQVFWDPALSPSALHGITTVIGGNCGFTIAPLEDDDADYVMRMLAVVEGMPLESLQAGVPWGSWRTVEEYLDRLPRTAVNIGFLAGHSTMRRAAMGDAAHEASPSEEHLATMESMLRQALLAGALGFSSSNGASHIDGEGAPVPSRFASDQEMLRLSAAVREIPGTTLEYIPSSPRSEAGRMAAMSRAADRPINWNVLVITAERHAAVAAQLSTSSDAAAEQGGEIVALANPAPLRFRRNLLSGFGFSALPGWESTFRLPVDQRIAALCETAVRERLREGLARATPAQAHLTDQEEWLVESVASVENAVFVGRTIGEIAASRSTDVFDAFLDIAVADRLMTTFAPPETGGDDASWKLRADVWRDRRVVLGASDAGAHLDMLCTFSYPTDTLAGPVRERGLLTVEEAVHLLADRPARLYGLTGRGRLSVGAHADIVVFDLAEVGPGPVSTRSDLPGGAPRLYSEGTGVRYVFVGGTPVVTGGAYTGEMGGSVLRSGRDTETVRPGTR